MATKAEKRAAKAARNADKTQEEELAQVLGVADEQAPDGESQQEQAGGIADEGLTDADTADEGSTEGAGADESGNTEGGENEGSGADEAPEEPKSTDDILRAVAENMPEPDRSRVIAELEKMFELKRHSQRASSWQRFDEEFRTKVTELLESLCTKYELEPRGEQITLTFPSGKAEYSRGHKAKGKSSNGGGKGREAPVLWGGAVVGDEQHGSPKSVADSLGLKVEGHTDMVDVFESQGHPVLELPDGDKLNALIAKQGDPERKAKLEGLRGHTFRVQV